MYVRAYPQSNIVAQPDWRCAVFNRAWDKVPQIKVLCLILKKVGRAWDGVSKTKDSV